MIRRVPIAGKAGEEFALPTYENVHAGKGFFIPDLYLYVNRPPGKPLDPWLREYLRMALSQEGQALVADTEKGTEHPYVTLNADDTHMELAKLE
jgi:phosphate transport system substrate-binding protein